MIGPRNPLAVMGGWVASELVEVSKDPVVLEGAGRWAVAITFEGAMTLARFARWERRDPRTSEGGAWMPPARSAWVSDLSREAYQDAVAQVRAQIERGQVYQANVCRILRAPIDPRADLVALHRLLAASNPAPFGGCLRLPDHGVAIASASPELFLRRAGGRVWSGPIKGTGRSAADLQAKDQAENVMIVDLVRNDLGRVCRSGTIEVPELMTVQPHPGLVHLVSLVSGELAPQAGWPELLAATLPPGSVSGAPKLSALEIIGSLEAGPRGPYCGAFGWVDADAGTAELAVAIRTFWREDGATGATLAFGTGAGITWSSDPAAEWRETELKADRLLRIASERIARERNGSARIVSGRIVSEGEVP